MFYECMAVVKFISLLALSSNGVRRKSVCHGRNISGISYNLFSRFHRRKICTSNCESWKESNSGIIAFSCLGFTFSFRLVSVQALRLVYV